MGEICWSKVSLLCGVTYYLCLTCESSITKENGYSKVRASGATRSHFSLLIPIAQEISIFMAFTTFYHAL